MGDSVLGDAKTLLRQSHAYARRLSADDLFQHGGILAATAVTAGALNFVFQVFMGWALTPAQYGVFGALFAVFYLTNVLGLGVQFSATRFTAALDADDPALGRLHGGLLLRAALLGGLLGAGLVLAAPLLVATLDVGTVWPVVFVAATIPFVFAFRANRGSLQGRQWFGLLGGYNVAYAGTKLAGAVALVVAFGWGIYGAFAGIGLAGLVVVCLTTLHVRRRLPGSGVALRSPEFDFASIYAFLSPAVLAGFCMTVPANVDVIVVSTAIGGHRAGLYVAASVVGKVLIFLPMGISKALFPKITSGQASGDAARTQALLDRALTYVGVLTGLGALAFVLVPELVLGLVFSPEYLAAAELVRWYGLAIVPFALAMVILNFELARDRTRFTYVFAAATVVEIGLMVAARGSMVRVVQVILGVNLALVAYGLYETKA